MLDLYAAPGRYFCTQYCLYSIVKRKNVFEHVYQNEIQIANQRPVLQTVNQILL